MPKKGNDNDYLHFRGFCTSDVPKWHNAFVVKSLYLSSGFAVFDAP